MELIKEEHICPICLSLLVEPMITSCNHIFCEFCIE